MNVIENLWPLAVIVGAVYLFFRSVFAFSDGELDVKFPDHGYNWRRGPMHLVFLLGRRFGQREVMKARDRRAISDRRRSR